MMKERDYGIIILWKILVLLRLMTTVYYNVLSLKNNKKFLKSQVETKQDLFVPKTQIE